MSDQRNLVIAIVLSLVILLGSQWLFQPPMDEQTQAQQTASQNATPGVPQAPGVPGATGPAVPDASVSREMALEQSPRIAIDAKRIRGSLSLRGARIDDVVLRDYKETIKPDSKSVTLLSPIGSARPYYASFGWAPVEGVKVPDKDTLWTADSDTLTTSRPVTLRWDNGEGFIFELKLAIDDAFMFTATQRVINNSDRAIDFNPYGLVSRTGTPKTTDFYILHEGPLGVFNEALTELSYDDLQEGADQELTSKGGWIGITDKYWLAALVPDQDTSFKGAFRQWKEGETDRYRTDAVQTEAVHTPAGGSSESTMRLFAGAKEVQLLDRYEAQFGIYRFDLAVDFGLFYWLTKPLFYAIDFFFRLLGNFGLAIMAITVCIKLIFFPLANKSYKAMSKMKTLQPKMMELREKYGDDRQKLNQEMMELYKKEKVNPAAGCLPILIQIPVFFCLYKVMFVTIEMRHQPFFGWIHDLAAPDPLNIFTLFGMVPWDTPGWLPILGIWPILMGISMYLQQLLNPQPADPMQAKIFLFMPLFFTFLLGSFPAGLVIYWTWNNILSVTQQWVIMKRMGAPIGRKAATKTS